VRIPLFWSIILAIFAVAAVLAFSVQPHSRHLEPFLVLKSQGPQAQALKNQPILTLSFEARPDSDTRLALMAPAHYGELRASVNGTAIAQKPLRQHMHISRYHSLYEAEIPENLVRSGTNELKIERLGSMRFVGVPDVYVGPVEALRRFGDHQEVLITWVDRATLFVIFSGLFVTAALLFFSRKIAHYFYFFLMFALLVPQEFRQHITIFSQPLLAYITYVGLTYLILPGLSLSYWTDGPAKERQIIWALGAAAICFVAVLDLIWGLDSEKTVFARATLFIACGMSLVVWLIRRLTNRRSAMPKALRVVFAFASAFSLGYVVAMVTLFGNVTATTRLLLVCFTNIAEAIAFMGLLATAAIYEFRAYQKTLAQNSHLKTIVSGRLLDLEDEAQRLKTQITSSAVTEERQRFTRDIHDGIGGQLLSLLLKARNGTLTPEEAETEVAHSIADLRLITAALDSSEDGLAAALESFAQRAKDQLDGADMILDWRLGSGFEAVHLDPRTVLEVLRWLQEGLTNAIRHSGGTLVTIHAALDNENNHVQIQLSDNGRGSCELGQKPAGRGIPNMAARAARLGGTFSIGKEQVGTALSLRFPYTSLAGAMLPSRLGADLHV
jgi:signal transduction histidine kinase